MALIFPNQRISYAEKIKDKNEWGRNMVNLLARYNTIYNNNYNKKLSNYQLFNNVLNQKDFENDCNAMGIEVGQFKDVILPYNKTYNKVQALLSTEANRPFKYIAALLNAEGIRKKEQKKTEMLQDWIETEVQLFSLQLQQKIQAKQAQVAIQQAPPENQEAVADMQNQQAEQLKMIEQQLTERQRNLVPPQEIEKWFTTKYRDSREITHAKILNYLVQNQKLKEKKNDSFKHGLISGESLLWVGTTEKGPELKVLNPLNVFYHKSPDIKYIQDGLFAGYKSYLSLVDIIDEYGEYLDEEDYKKLTEKSDRAILGMGTHSDIDHYAQDTMHYKFDTTEDAFWQSTVQGHSTYGQYGVSNHDEYMVTHVEWISQREVGFLTTTNEYGDPETIIVDEYFKVPSTAQVQLKTINGKKTKCYYFVVGQQQYKYESKWIPQTWQGTRIGQDIYVNIQPKPYQYFSIDRPTVHKLGYHGVSMSNMNAEPVSLMDRMKPYQYLYFVVMHKLKKLIAKDQGKLFHFDVTMIPDELGLEKTMYYLQEMDIDFYNPLKNMDVAGAFQRSKVTSSTDRSNMQHIVQYINLLNYLDQMISDVAGVSRPMEGQTQGNQAVTNAQSDLNQSALVTEIYFDVHNRMWEDALNSLLSISTKYYKENKVQYLQYVLDDLSLETINISEEDLEPGDIGVFITHSSKETQIFETLKQLSQAIIQNQAGTLSHVIGILQSDSLAELKRDIKSYETETASQKQQEFESQRKLQMEAAEYARQTMLMREEAITERELQKSELAIYQWSKDLDQDDNGKIDFLELEKLKTEEVAQDNSHAIDKEKIEIEKAKLKLKDKEIDSKERISKSKPKSTK